MYKYTMMYLTPDKHLNFQGLLDTYEESGLVG